MKEPKKGERSECRKGRSEGGGRGGGRGGEMNRGREERRREKGRTEHCSFMWSLSVSSLRFFFLPLGLPADFFHLTNTLVIL